MRRRPSLLQIIYSRRTIRRFSKSKPLSEDIVRMLVEAGQRAPCYYQAYSIVWVRDEERIKSLAEMCDSETTRSMILNASAVLLICVDFYRLRALLNSLGHHHILSEDKFPVEAFYGVFETGLMVENICIAAEVLGLGSALLDCALFECERMALLFQLPHGVIPAAILCVGEKGENPPPRPRWPLEHVLHIDSYKPVQAEDIENYLDLSERTLASEGYLRKYAEWNGSYTEYLMERTLLTKEIKKTYDVIASFLKRNGLKL